MKSYSYHYFYEIKNNINGHFYYGIHSTDNLEDGYMGSGLRLHYAYKKYGMENFSKTILKYFDSRKEASEYEAEMVTEELVRSNDCYNVRLGGDNGKTAVGFVAALCEDGKYHYVPREEVTDRNKIRGVGYVPTKQGLIPIEEFYKNRNKYTTLTEDRVTVKDKNGNFYSVNKDDERYVSGELVATFTGCKHSEETLSRMKKTFSERCHQQGEKNSRYGTVWITDGITNKSIKKEDLEKYISEGWQQGRKINESPNRPPKEELIKDMKNLQSFVAIGKKYGVESCTAQGWFRQYEIPSHISDYKKIECICDKDKLVNCIKKYDTISDIAKCLKISPTSVRNYMKKYNLYEKFKNK